MYQRILEKPLNFILRALFHTKLRLSCYRGTTQKLTKLGTAASFLFFIIQKLAAVPSFSSSIFSMYFRVIPRPAKETVAGFRVVPRSHACFMYFDNLICINETAKSAAPNIMPWLHAYPNLEEPTIESSILVTGTSV